MQNQLINAVCCCFPSGENLWFESEKGSEYLSKVIDAWTEQHPEYNGVECTMGCVEIRMPVEKYHGIQAVCGANEFQWPKA